MQYPDGKAMFYQPQKLLEALKLCEYVAETIEIKNMENK